MTRPPYAMVLLFLAIAVGSLTHAYFGIRANFQKTRLRDAANFALAMGGSAPTFYDWWDRPIWVEVTEETSYREANATSAGADGAMGTEDDWAETCIDINKSFIAGAWTAEKAPEFARGVWETVKRKAKETR
jgi:hypothetical protein